MHNAALNNNRVPSSIPPNENQQDRESKREEQSQQQLIPPRLLTVEQQEKLYQDKPHLQKLVKLDLKPNERVFVITGCNWGGKTTFAKVALKHFDAKKFDESCVIYKFEIHNNIVESILELVNQAQNAIIIQRCEKDEIQDLAAPIKLIKNENQDYSSETLTLASIVWKHPAIQKMYHMRNRSFHIQDSISYYMDNIERIKQPKYRPTREDVIRSRKKTVGIITHSIVPIVNNCRIRIKDVGAERVERNKWLTGNHSESDIIFIVAADEFDQTIYENNRTMRLDESLSSWRTAIEAPKYRNCNFFLVFNKIDLLIEKIKTVDFRNYRSDFKGDHTNYHHILRYLIRLFLSLAQEFARKIYISVTCAFDEVSMRRFWDTVVSIPAHHSKDLFKTSQALANHVANNEEWVWNVNHFIQYPISVLDTYTCFTSPYQQLSSSSSSSCTPYDLLSFTDLAITTSDAHSKFFIHVHSYYIQQQFPNLYRELIKSSRIISEKNYQKKVIEYRDCSIRTLQEIIAFVYTRKPHPFSKWPFPVLVSSSAGNSSSQKQSYESLKKLCLINSTGKEEQLQQKEEKSSSFLLKLVKSIITVAPSKKKKKRDQLLAAITPSAEYDLLQKRVLSQSLVQLNEKNSNILVKIGDSSAELLLLVHDLNILVGGTLLNYDAQVLKAHNLFMCDILPFFPFHTCKNPNSGTITWVAPCMLSPQSVQNILWFVYNNFDSSKVEEILNQLSLQQLIDTLYMHKMMVYQQDHTQAVNHVNQLIEKRLGQVLTCNNVALVYNTFFNDQVDLSVQLREQLSSIKRVAVKQIPGKLTVLPVEVLYIIYQFLSAQALVNEENETLQSEEKMLKQEELSFLRFAPIEFKRYLVSTAPECLLWKSRNLSFEPIRQICVKFASENWSSVEKSDYFKTRLSSRVQQKFEKACEKLRQAEEEEEEQQSANERFNRDSIGSTPSSLGSSGHFMIEEVQTMIEEQQQQQQYK